VSPTSASKTPLEVRLRAYNVGFGDCILITVTYRDNHRRHMLVDFGSTKAAGTNLRTTANALRGETAGEGIAVAIVTHQHRDHIAGFATKPLRGDDPVAALQPKLLIRPWMDQSEPAGVGPRSRRHAELLHRMDNLVRAARSVPAARPGSPVSALLNLQLKDTDAGRLLASWEGAGTTTRYVKAGDTPSLTRYLPGANLEIIGPPTVEQVPFLASYDRDDPEQFWARHNLSGAAIQDRLRAKFDERDLKIIAGDDGLGAAAWLAKRISSEQRDNLLAAARGFDAFLNNTSVIAVLTIGRRTLLLCGDAQIEGWAQVLARADALTPGLRERFADTDPPQPDGLAGKLANLDLYKVGHHGSKNATPKTLFALWENQRLGSTPIVTIMSTLAKFHGERASRGEVPRTTLVRALRTKTAAYSTHMLDPTDTTHWLDLTAPTIGAGTFTGKRGRLTQD
jgi:hypothetical protein